MYTDSHCHLSAPSLMSQMSDVRSAMQAAQVTRALCICTTMEEFDAVHGLALAYDNFWCTVGVHPDNENVHEPTMDELLEVAFRGRIITGLDHPVVQDRLGRV